MKKTLFAIMVSCLWLYAGGSFAAQPYWNSGNTEKVIEGVENTATSIITDSFVPMTHYSESNWTVRVVPVGFRVDRAYDEPEIEGEDFYGWGGAVGGGYALTDQLMIYGIFDYVETEGDLKGRVYGDDFDELKTGVEYRTFYIASGAGYDLIKGGRKWSIPVYAGLYTQYYDADLDLPMLVNDLPPYTIDGTVNGNGYLYGFSGGVALSYHFLDYVKITPYYLINIPFNESEFEAEINHSSYPSQINEPVKPGKLNTSMLGLNISFDTNRSLSFSIGIGGMVFSQIDSYSRNYLDGLNIKSVAFAVSYNGGGY
jgi:hypothetical protein